MTGATVPLSFDVTAAPAAADLAAVDAWLDAFNQGHAALADVRPLSVFGRAEGGRLIAGAVGRTWGDCCELQQLAVDPARRGQGLGQQLLQEFEAAAAARGCSLVYLDTFSFQAPRFYQRAGYRVVLETRGYTQGTVKYTMHKVLMSAITTAD